MFDIYFNINHGFIVDFPFMKFDISTPALITLGVAIVAFKVAKFIKARKSNTPAWDATPSLFDTDPFAWEAN